MWPKLQNKYPDDPGNPDDHWMLQKEEVESPIKKIVERMEVCLVANGRYFEKEKVKCRTFESQHDASE